MEAVVWSRGEHKKVPTCITDQGCCSRGGTLFLFCHCHYYPVRGWKEEKEESLRGIGTSETHPCSRQEPPTTLAPIMPMHHSLSWPCAILTCCCLLDQSYFRKFLPVHFILCSQTKPTSTMGTQVCH